MAIAFKAVKAAARNTNPYIFKAKGFLEEAHIRFDFNGVPKARIGLNLDSPPSSGIIEL